LGDHSKERLVSQRRDELIQLRKEHFARLERMRQLGDYDAGAADSRWNAEVILTILDDMLERAR
jgi:hypothetical protein